MNQSLHEAVKVIKTAILNVMRQQDRPEVSLW